MVEVGHVRQVVDVAAQRPPLLEQGLRGHEATARRGKQLALCVVDLAGRHTALRLDLVDAVVYDNCKTVRRKQVRRHGIVGP